MSDVFPRRRLLIVTQQILRTLSTRWYRSTHQPPGQGYKEIVHVHYYDDESKTFTQVTTDQELQLLVDRHSESKAVLVDCIL